jgi:hypothetical protein
MAVKSTFKVVIGAVTLIDFTDYDALVVPSFSQGVNPGLKFRQAWATPFPEKTAGGKYTLSVMARRKNTAASTSVKACFDATIDPPKTQLTCTIYSSDGGEWECEDAAVISSIDPRVDPADPRWCTLSFVIQCGEITETTAPTVPSDPAAPSAPSSVVPVYASTEEPEETAAEQLLALGTCELLWMPDSVVSTGNVLTEWTDLSGNDNHGVPVAGTNGLKPVALAGGGVALRQDHYIDFTTRLTNIRTVVMRLALGSRPVDGTEARPLLGDNTVYDFHGSEGATGPVFSSFAATAVKNGTLRIDGSAETGTTYIFPADQDGPVSLTLVTTGAVAASRLSRERTNAKKSWEGNVLCLAIFSDALSGADILAAEAILDTL